MHTRRRVAAAVVATAIASVVHGCAASGDPASGRPRGGGGSSSTGGTGGGGKSGEGGGGAAGSFMNPTGTGGGGTAAATGGMMAAGGVGGELLADAGFMDMCSPSMVMPASPEVCGNGLDDNLNGFIDELDDATRKVCPCTPGTTQPCFGGRPWDADRPNCMKGTQKCEGSEFPGWGKCTGWMCGDVPPPEEECFNNLDDDCDGAVDEGCVLDVPVDIMGDCVEASCPGSAPYPSGCDLNMMGGDSRGCVANTPGSSTVYFQEGDKCPFLGLGDAGHIVGTLFCAVEMRDPLSAMNCTTMKADNTYPTDKSACPK